MDFLSLAQKRCSIRDYSSKEIEQEKLDYILEVAHLAPSACNMQPWKFVVIQTPELLQKLHNCYDREWFKSASVCIVICGDHKTSWKRKYDNKDHCDIDIAIAADHITLAATEMELGSCWICNFDPELCKKVLQLDSGLDPIVIIPIGYPAQKEVWETTPKKRKNKEDIIIYK